MAEIAPPMQQQQQRETVAAAPPPPPPPTQRRPRVREVRSRFMSPVVCSSSPSPGDLHLPGSKSPVIRHAPDSRQQQQQRSVSAQRRRRLDLEPSSHADENRSELTRSLDTPLLGAGLQSKGSKVPSRASRSDTPIVSTSMDRIVSSRFRQTPQNLPRAVSAGASAATKLLHSIGMPVTGGHASGLKAAVDENSNVEAGSVVNCHSENSAQLLWSSMPDADMLPSVSNRLLAERNVNGMGNLGGSDSSKIPASPLSRMLSSPLSSCDMLNSVKASEKSAHGSLKQHMALINAGKVCLPPVAPCTKTVMDAKKGRKVSSHQEDVHSLKLLNNHYLQWRFANAKAEAAMQAQKMEAEKMLFSLSVKLGDLYNSVMRKRAELGTVHRAKAVSAILESQMPYLDEWSTCEGDYLASLSEVTQALSNASIQLPISGNVRADVRELGEVLSSSMKITDTIASHVESFMPKAQQLEVLISELARVVSRERVVIEESGDLLSKRYLSQVEECSLRGQIIQFHRYRQSIS
ncbi:protein ENDOSPERM DEFECTIVE 1-like [Rhodamnia argentea]|uniref:Protein ENDOSPERM DEFECTIVE 1-like n=1 Tax=Rhodamnia argentea TaxID=178133 RepID=A0A8B8QWJ4_9MYRT|nr:protein ENDOSPERM DEFECTIVE 1-like [Rhodamnia argentea]